ncbi:MULTISPECIES: hypothetical protein [unclassified Sphingobium]|uniref:hypothetical protein n=1 Tax=unclassified Sphingobium TaxID=2611147 RepID=UPI0035A6E5E0
MKLTDRQFYGVVAVLAVLLIIAIANGGGQADQASTTRDSPTEATAASLNSADDTEAGQTAAPETADSEAKGFHCLSTWDGSNRSLVEQMKENLRNPSSFEHADTLIGPATSTGYHPIRMKYRAENGFGGMNIEEVAAAVDHKSCEATIITSVEQMNRLLPSS